MQTFDIAPATFRSGWLFLLLLVPLVIVVAVVVVTLIGARSARFEVGADGLRLRGDFYGRVIPAAELRPEGARRVDFAASPELAPARRTLGTGLPGYQSGWFRLRNGERALLYLTDRARAVYVPTSAGYSVLVSPADPDAFLASLDALSRDR
ncbi:MAG: PH domain-containing protein [Vicinamibacterales bacterium]